MKVILTEAGVDPGVWKPHAVRSASSSHHTTSKQLDLEQICHLADWSMASSTYLKFYKRYVWVPPPWFYLLFVLLVHIPLLYWKLRLIHFSTSSLHLLIITSSYFVLRSEFISCLHFIYCKYTLRICSWIYVFIYPLTDVPKATRSSECYASFLLAPAEGWSFFTL